ncbi:hypothetical protein CRG98_002166 [Punica granatum]|uniref:Uncharacterized protein n=1 Tax=Punica granatum TaxID=22663 RepID=A0A2I0L9N5_PUNGR|nr:hypothetical protein CRG98_002166 [Punica granatum]
MDGTTGCGEIGVVAMSPEDALAAWFRKRFPNQDKPATIGTKSSGNNQHLKAKELEEKITVNPGAGAVRPSRGTTSSATACPKSKNHMKQSIFFIGFPQKEAGDDIRAIGKQVGLKNNVGGTTPKPLGQNPSIRPAHA